VVANPFRQSVEKDCAEKSGKCKKKNMSDVADQSGKPQQSDDNESAAGKASVGV
jgi:hypothetical protein